MTDKLPPLPNSGLAKFGPALGPCKPGEKCYDATHLLTTGEPCCSSCRKLIKPDPSNEFWVHS